MTVVYLNGEFVDREEGHVSAGDRGLLLGVGIFETLRAYHGTPFRLERHLDRLVSSARDLDLALRAPREEIGKAAIEVVRRNGLEEGRVRITCTGGGAGPGKPPGPSVLVTAVPIGNLPPEIYEDGVRVVISPLEESMALARHKVTSAMEKVIALREAERAGAFEAVFLNPAGRVCECASSNLFLMQGGKLRTPPVSEGILPGITREIVLSLAPEIGIPASEGRIEEEELLRADEIIITASVKEIVPVVKVGDRTIGDGRPGPGAKALIQAYRDLVEKECAPSGRP